MMWRLHLVMLYGTFACLCCAQTSYQNGFPALQGNIADDSLRILASRVAAYARKAPQEIVSVHMDNNCYFLGDTIWYKAYVLRDGKMTPSDISGVLYTELINPDGYLFERQTLRLHEGVANGSFCLNDTTYAGYYELRAYTRWQLNWGQHEHPRTKGTNRWFLSKDLAKDFYRDYDKLYSRVFPVYDKPQAPGDYSQIMSPRPLRRYYKLHKEQLDAKVSFFPEGGAWVEGVEQRLAFEATSEKGEHLDGHLQIKDRKGNTIAEARTEHRGRGLLTIRATPGEEYHAEFLWGNGVNTEVKLPKRESEGVSIRAEESTQGIKVHVMRHGMQNIPLGMTIMQNGAVRYQCDADSGIIIVPRDCLDVGVAQITTFDQNGRIWADRLIFCGQDKTGTGNVSLIGLPHTLGAYDRADIKVKANVGGIISIAIRDAAHSPSTYDNGNLLTEALLCSQIKGFVESPGYYFESDDSLHRLHLDLLLMVQGWRRHEWRQMTLPFQLLEPFEISPILRGDVNRYIARDTEDFYYTVPVQDINVFRNAFPTSGACGPKIEEVRRRVEDATKTADMVTILDADVSQANVNVDLPSNANKPTVNAEANWYSKGGNNLKLSSKKEEALLSGFYSTAMDGGDPADSQFISPLKTEVNVRAEFSVLSNQAQTKNAVINTDTRHGLFAIQAPHADTPYYLHLIATKNGKKEDMVSNADEHPAYSIRLRTHYPRFVKPYSFYQTRSPMQTDDVMTITNDSTTAMAEVTVGARRGGLRKLDLNKPALVVDAYEAYNQVVDAGLMPAWLPGSLFFSLNLARLYIGDMGQPRTYELERRWSGHTATYFTDIKEQLRYNHLRNLDRVLIYTDYAPRLEGDDRYQTVNLPSVTVNLVSLPDNMERPTNRDRQYVMKGYNVCEDFYHPHYEQKPLPQHTDYRRTLYWNPNLKLDSNGEASITLWGNSRECYPAASVEGISTTGNILTGKAEEER